MNEIVLRPYQKKFIGDVRQAFIKGNRRVVGVAPCGAGKTIITGWMIRQALQRGKSSLFFVHRKELIEQTSQTFEELHIPHGIISGGFKPNYEFPVQIASVQTLVKRLNLIKPPNFLVCDECHHILADTYKKIIEFWKDSFLLGVTATPERTGGITLCDVFSDMVLAPSVKELIELGNLTNFNYYGVNLQLEAELSSLKIVQGDYIKSGLSKLMTDPRITQKIIESYKKHALNKSTICYCVNVEHSKHVATYFNEAGIPTAQCDGQTPKSERTRIVEDFRRGKYKVLCNAELFGEGFDVPNCHCVILARPTKSKILHVQQSMRSMRPDPNDPNKVAVIIDCVNNYVYHGYPDDERKWTLKPNKEKECAPEKICPYCESAIPLSSKKCPVCGADLSQIKEHYRMKLKIKATELIYDSRDTAIVNLFKKLKTAFERQGRNKPNFQAAIKAINYNKNEVTYEDLLRIAQLSGYQRGWAYHQWQDLKKLKSESD